MGGSQSSTSGHDVLADTAATIAACLRCDVERNPTAANKGAQRLRAQSPALLERAFSEALLNLDTHNQQQCRAFVHVLRVVVPDPDMRLRVIASKFVQPGGRAEESQCRLDLMKLIAQKPLNKFCVAPADCQEDKFLRAVLSLILESADVDPARRLGRILRPFRNLPQILECKNADGKPLVSQLIATGGHPHAARNFLALLEHAGLSQTSLGQLVPEHLRILAGAQSVPVTKATGPSSSVPANNETQQQQQPEKYGTPRHEL